MAWSTDEVFAVGDHLYALCPDCGSLIKVTGWWKGIHLCTAKPRAR